MSYRRYDTQYNDTQYNDTQFNDTIPNNDQNFLNER
jgi:hypothetical protein